jgi:hypothetical protein
MLLSKRGIHFSSEMLVEDRGGRIVMRVLVICLLCFALCGAVRADEQARGWLGAAVDDLSAKDAAKLGMETPHGVIVTRRDAGAEKAGLETGDVILGLDRTLVENKAGFEADVAAKAPGTEIKLLVRRGAREKGLTVALAAEPKPVLAVEGKPILQLDTGGHRAVIRTSPSRRTASLSSPQATIRSSGYGIGGRA